MTPIVFRGDYSGLDGALGAGVAAKASDLLATLQETVKQNLTDTGVGNETADLLSQGFSQIAAFAIGSVVGGNQVGLSALAVDTNNRQLHDNEKAKIKALSNGNVASESRLTAAACALVRCYAQYEEGSEAYNRLKAMANAGESEALSEERQILRAYQQAGLFRYSTIGLLSDENLDAIRQLDNTYQIGARALGVGVGAAGTVATAVIILSAPASCATVIGCGASVVGGSLSIDAAATGFTQAISGEPESTLTNNALQSLGLSPEAALYTELALSLVAPTKAFQVAAKNTAPVVVVTPRVGGVVPNNIQQVVTKGLSSNANFAQKTFRNKFSDDGIIELSKIAGRPINTVDDLANAIRSGTVSSNSIPVNVIVRDGNTLILNTRTVQALEQAGISRSSFNVINRTGDEFFEGLLSGQLSRNKLTSQGIPSARRTGK